MAYLTPVGSNVPAPSPMLAQPMPFLDLRGLRDGLADRRRRILDLELAMVAACEAEAARSRASGVKMHDRETWDSATWQRYLAAAAAVEPDFGPKLRQLYREIAQLERVIDLPVARRAIA